MTVLTTDSESEAAKKAMVMKVLARAPEWTLFSAAAICAWRWGRLDAKLPRQQGKQPKMPLARSGGPASDPPLRGECLTLVKLLSQTPPDLKAANTWIESAVIGKRSPNAFWVLLEIALELGILLLERSPMLRSLEDLLQEESLRMEVDFIAKYG